MGFDSALMQRLGDRFIEGIFQMAEFAANLLSETLRERSGFAPIGSATAAVGLVF
jgi:hypothetical protein